MKPKILTSILSVCELDEVGIWRRIQHTIEDVIIFRIDSRTIKREILWLSGLSSVTRCY